MASFFNSFLSISLTLIISLLVSFYVYGQKETFFKSPSGIYLISADLHIHTVFSDGSVWPDIRVQEALRESVDLIAITDHIEYQPHAYDIPNPDRNRSFQIATSYNNKPSDLIVINGAEITRKMAPGHINAVFINNANKLIHNDSLSGIKEANKQGAFVFWNHPNWTSQRKDGIAKLDPYHKFLIKEKLLHGIEVVNETTFSEEAFAIALENDLTVLGTSDIHSLIDWAFNLSSGGHRPMTFVLSKNKDISEIKNALLSNKTFIWFEDIIIGKQENLMPVIYSNLTATPIGYKSNTILAQIILNNHSSLPLKLEYTGTYNLHEKSKFLEIPAKSSQLIYIKTKEFKKNVEISFRVLNAFIEPNKNPTAFYNLEIK